MQDLLLGLNIRGELSIYGAAITKAGDTGTLSSLWAALREMGVGSAGVALIDGLGGMEDVFTQVFTTLFPNTKLLSASIFWIAALKGEVDPADWSAMLRDYAAIYECATAGDVQSAIANFKEHWGAKYAAIAERVDELSGDPDKVVEIGAALTEQGMDVAQMVNVLANFFGSKAYESLLKNGD